MSPSRILLLALAGLSPFPLIAQTAPAVATTAEPPEKIVRFEQMLVRSPGPGRAFDEVFSHYFATEGAAALAARWTAARDASPAGSAEASAYGLLLGQLAERIGDFTTARIRYTEAAAAAPKDFRPLHRLGRLELREAKLPAALAAFEKALVLDMGPADAQDVLRDLARTRSRAFDEAGALTAWKDLAARFPDDALVLEEVGQAQLDAAAYDDAAATFTSLEKAASGDAYRAVLARLRLGEVAAKKGDKEAALARFSAALDGTHRDSWLHREAQNRVDSLFRDQGDYDGLIAFHEGRLSGASRDPAAARRLAELLIELDRTDKALEWFDKATGWAPDDHALRFAQIRALITAKRDADALPLLETLVKRYPKESSYRDALGQLHWDRIKTAADASAASSERALALETWAGLAPKDAPVTDLLALAEIYRTHDLAEETRATLARAVAAEPASYDLRERLALQLLSMKRDDEAWALARGGPKGLADAGQYRRLASLEKRNGLFAESLVSIDRGLALAPDNYELLELRWQVLAELLRWDDALVLFPRLLAQAPGDFARDTIESRHLQALRSAGKLDSTLADLAKRVADADPALTEADHRLHIRLVLAQQLPVPADVTAAFAAARKAFPDSFSIAQLEADYLERSAPLAERIAALRRLGTLRPERSAEWLRRLVGTYRFEGDTEGARKAVAELIALAPADAQNHVLAADLEFDSGNADAGITALQRALRLASDPAPVRSRLARAYLEQNRPAAALAIYEEAFYAAADDNARRAFLAPMTESAVIAGDLDGLLIRFAERNRPRRDSAAYHIELGEIYFNARDYVRAQESWNRALELKRDDPRLIARLLDLARQNGDNTAVVKLARLRYEREATPVNGIELGEALLATNAAPEAVELFLANTSYFYSDTTLLGRVLPVLAAKDLSEPLIARLRAESAAAADPSDRDLVLATAFITLRDFTNAERLLWDVYRRPPAAPAAAPAATATPAPAASLMAANRAPQPFMIAQQALQTTAQSYQGALQLLQNQSGGRYYRSGSRGYGGYGMNLPPSLTVNQDTALGYLGALAVTQNKPAEFLARLKTELDSRNLSASERFIEYAKVQAREAALAEFDAVLAEPTPSVAALYIAQNFIPERPNPYTGIRPEPSPELAAKLKLLNETLAKLTPPGSQFQQRVQQLYQLVSNKKFDEAFAGLEELKTTPGLSENERRQLQSLALQFALQAKHWDEFLKLLAQCVADDPNFQGSNILHYVGAYLNREADTDGKPIAVSESDYDTLANLVLDASAKPVPAGLYQQYYPQFGSRRGMGGSSAVQQELQTIFQQGASLGGQPLGMNYQFKHFVTVFSEHRVPFVTRLLAVAEKRDAAVLASARLLALQLAFAADDSEQAELLSAPLLADKPEPGLLFNLAELSFRADKLDLAKTRYSAIPASAGVLAMAAECRLLELALQADDTEAAKASATRLVRLRPPSYLPNLDLNSTLRELGLDKTLKPAIAINAAVRPQRNAQQNRYEEINRLNNELNELLNKKDFAAAERIANRLLANASLADARQGNDYGRRSALSAYIRIGLMEAYVADLDAQLARNPDSVLVIELLAEAHSVIRQNAGNASSGNLVSVAASATPLPLPLRLRLVRKGDTYTASYAPVVVPAPVDPALPSVTAVDSVPPAPVWTELGAVTLADFDSPPAGLAGRNQNFGKFTSGLFSDIRFSGQPVPADDFKKRDNIRLGDQSAVFYSFAAPLEDGASIEAVLDAPDSPKIRVPAVRGLVLRDATDKFPRVSLLRGEDGTLSFNARRYTGRLAEGYLAKLVSLRPRDEQLRNRYINTLFETGRADDALAFLARPENQDQLLRFASNSQVINAHRKAGTLATFAEDITNRAITAGTRPGQYPQIDYQVLELARNLRRSGDTAAAIIIWEKILPVLRDDQSSTVRSELVSALLDADTAENRTRSIPIIRDYFISRPVTEQKPAPVFNDFAQRYYQQPWYSNFSSSGSRLISPAFNLLDNIDDPEFLRALIAENAPRLAAPDAGWEPRCYDLALKIRAGDPGAGAAFATLWNDAVAQAKRPPEQRQSYQSQFTPLNGFLPACFERVSGLPDPDIRIADTFRSAFELFPKRSGMNVISTPSTIQSPFLNNPWAEFGVRFSWADYLLTRGDIAGSRQALLDLNQSTGRQDPRQINSSLPSQILGRLLAIGDITEARRVHDTTLVRVQRRQGNRNSTDTRAKRLVEFLDALEGKGDAPAPALAAWVVPSANGTSELHWEVSARLDSEKNNDAKSLPRVFGLPRASTADGTYDLLVEFVADANSKSEPLAKLELPSVASRGRHRLDSPPSNGFFRATLHPRDGGDDIVLAPQLYSTLSNLLPNPEARTDTRAPAQIPGWNMPIRPLSYAGGPSVGGTVTFIATPINNNNNERTTRTAPIPVDPNNTYLISAWANSLPEEYAQIGIEFLDAKGNALSNNRPAQGTDNSDFRWQRILFTLAPDRRLDMNNRQNIPAEAVALRIWVTGQPGLRISDLCVQEIPTPAPPAPVPVKPKPDPAIPKPAPGSTPMQM
jgi:predicted Zn-dependent protease